MSPVIRVVGGSHGSSPRAATAGQGCAGSALGHVSAERLEESLPRLSRGFLTSPNLGSGLSGGRQLPWAALARTSLRVGDPTGYGGWWRGVRQAECGARPGHHGNRRAEKGPGRPLLPVGDQGCGVSRSGPFPPTLGSFQKVSWRGGSRYPADHS